MAHCRIVALYDAWQRPVDAEKWRERMRHADESDRPTTHYPTNFAAPLPTP
jgi:hypothetical protein